MLRRQLHRRRRTREQAEGARARWRRRPPLGKRLSQPHPPINPPGTRLTLPGGGESRSHGAIQSQPLAKRYRCVSKPTPIVVIFTTVFSGGVRASPLRKGVFGGRDRSKGGRSDPDGGRG
eukprot:scaffold102_cov340-Pavlova_lutheri.AAC.9